MIDWLIEPLQYSFIVRALLAAVVVGIVGSVLGTYVILRGMAFFGDALAHTILPGVVIAFLFGWPLAVGALIMGVLTALGIGAVVLAFVALVLSGIAVVPGAVSGDPGGSIEAEAGDGGGPSAAVALRGLPRGGVLSRGRFPQWQRDYLTLLAQRDLHNVDLVQVGGLNAHRIQVTDRDQLLPRGNDLAHAYAHHTDGTRKGRDKRSLAKLLLHL